MLLKRKYFLFSLFFHFTLFLILVLGFDFTAPLPVFEQSNKNDVISAVILGETEKSNILPQNLPQQSQQKEEITPKVKKIEPPAIKKEVVPLQVKKEMNQKNIFAKDLLADINRVRKKQKAIQQKQIKAQFEKTLKEHAELTLRKQLLAENITLKGTESREAQGEVNKYKALMLQAISEQWIIPLQANKKLYCELIIRLAPSGMVLDVQVKKSSGDPSLDASARAAVLKASPLPVPSNPQAFETFRQFVLKVKPENVLMKG
ncbi:MAG: protein TolA [Gammaproteobacteria bacterium RIFCSPHIGHO2_12_FULL_38_14]|nr:MAG: protein TolA [Gammaproteobacteria bacterium RIFCSPHIGHO2_12_FULL_38_14]